MTQSCKRQADEFFRTLSSGWMSKHPMNKKEEGTGYGGGNQQLQIFRALQWL